MDPKHRLQALVQKNVLQKLQNKTSEQTDLILAQEFNLEVKSTVSDICTPDDFTGSAFLDKPATCDNIKFLVEESNVGSSLINFYSFNYLF